MDETTAYLALGANIGGPRDNMRAAVRLLGESGACHVTAVSSLYLTKPVGITDQPDFLNAVIAVRTTLSPAELLDLCRNVENTLGRKRTIRWGPRVIDIDILLYGDAVISEENLVIPHPDMVDRAFVMVPLAEIAPDILLPGRLNARDAAEKLDRGDVLLIEGPSWSR